MGKRCGEIRCFLCPDIDGAMKKVSYDGGTDNLFAHVACVNWIPEMYFQDDKKEKVIGTLQKERFTLNCNRCKRKDGACIQCDFKCCARSYHVRCLVRGGVIKSWEAMQSDLGDPDDDSNTPIFCQEHFEKGIELFKK